MAWVGWSLLGLALLLAVDRLGRWGESRGWVYWRRGRGSAAAGPAIGELVEVFQPGRRHLVEEQDRRRVTAEAQESGGLPLVDLDAGIARLPRPPAPPRGGHP